MNPKEIHDLSQIVLQKLDGYDVDNLAHYIIDGVYTKVFVSKKAGTFIGQHSHTYDHGHLVCAGSMRLFIDGKESGDFSVGDLILIKAYKEHVLMSLEDNTVGACIHNTHGLNEVSIEKRAELH